MNASHEDSVIFFGRESFIVESFIDCYWITVKSEVKFSFVGMCVRNVLDELPQSNPLLFGNCAFETCLE